MKFAKSTSHRARRKVTQTLGELPQTYYSLVRHGPAATAFFWVTDKQWKQIKEITGVSGAQHRDKDNWRKTWP